MEFIIVGGLAATIHGGSRLTQAIDVVYDRSDANLARLVNALAPYEPHLRGAPHGLSFDWSAATLKRGLNFTLTTTIGDVGLFGEIAGAGDFAALSAHCTIVPLFGHACRCVDLEALIRMKRAAGRPKDLEVIAELEALAEETRRQ